MENILHSLSFCAFEFVAVSCILCGSACLQASGLGTRSLLLNQYRPLLTFDPVFGSFYCVSSLCSIAESSSDLLVSSR